jgi:ribonucleoside-diphosphate reductase alpha chain
MNPVTLQEEQQEIRQIRQEMSPFAKTIYEQKYARTDDTGKVVETWEDTAYRVTQHVLGALGYHQDTEEFQIILKLISERKFMPGGRYLYASGRPLHQVQNCLLLKAEDSREGWADLLSKAAMALQTGAGIGVDYSDIRPSGALIHRTGGVASGPLSLMQMVNEIGRGVMQGGSRRSAIWAGLNWAHDDVEDFINLKNWSDEVRALKAKDFSFPAGMEFTNISVLLDDAFFAAYEQDDHPKHERAHYIYDLAVSNMLRTAEPGLSVDIGLNEGETLRNACTEVTSHDDSDICNLGSINLARIDSLEEFNEAVHYGTLFLLAGTVYSDVPYDRVDDIRKKNRRLGLGLMGVHEWLLKRGYRYEPNEELGQWLEVYARSTDQAEHWAGLHGLRGKALTPPIKTRAIAPTGTIGIIAETTTGIEPIFCVAFKRRYLHEGKNWNYQFVIDPTAKRLIDEVGVDPNSIEDAYVLSYDVERRVKMQAWVQGYVDHGISSTINLPYPIEDETEVGEFKDMLYRYLPQLRGVTVYPDGARGGQPLTVATYEEAVQHEGTVFEEDEARCKSGSCGI